MIDIKSSLVSTLITATGLPVYYELIYKAGTIPAITYIEVDNADLYNGDTLNYSTLRYQIKVWSNDMATLISKSIAIDAALKDAGWSRYMSMETNDSNNTLIKVLRYVATGYDEV